MTEQENFKKADRLKSIVNNWIERTFNYIQLEIYEKILGENFIEYIRSIDEPEREDYENEEDYNKAFSEWEDQTGENYPMWNTLFEFRSSVSEDLIEACIKANIGIIDKNDFFETTLFFRGCGYSFYGEHWIPLFLSLSWNEDYKKEFEGVNYSMI